MRTPDYFAGCQVYNVPPIVIGSRHGGHKGVETAPEIIPAAVWIIVWATE